MFYIDRLHVVRLFVARYRFAARRLVRREDPKLRLLQLLQRDRGPQLRVDAPFLPNQKSRLARHHLQHLFQGGVHADLELFRHRLRELIGLLCLLKRVDVLHLQPLRNRCRLHDGSGGGSGLRGQVGQQRRIDRLGKGENRGGNRNLLLAVVATLLVSQNERPVRHCERVFVLEPVYELSQRVLFSNLRHHQLVPHRVRVGIRRVLLLQKVLLLDLPAPVFEKRLLRQPRRVRLLDGFARGDFVRGVRLEGNVIVYREPDVARPQIRFLLLQEDLEQLQNDEPRDRGGCGRDGRDYAPGDQFHLVEVTVRDHVVVGAQIGRLRDEGNVEIQVVVLLEIGFLQPDLLLTRFLL
mmetsp:Transcript_22467/g.56779  ORF Transcript_22467/g.56779 Transcript_22467/m.56779 type:complete len:352 (-) Transcript_22467:682-1737(-)